MQLDIDERTKEVVLSAHHPDKTLCYETRFDYWSLLGLIGRLSQAAQAIKPPDLEPAKSTPALKHPRN